MPSEEVILGAIEDTQAQNQTSENTKNTGAIYATAVLLSPARRLGLHVRGGAEIPSLRAALNTSCRGGAVVALGTTLWASNQMCSATPTTK